jgi:hypothetical protein
MFTGMGKHWASGFQANAWGVGYALRNARRAVRAHKRTHNGENIRLTDYTGEIGQTAGEIYRLLDGRGDVRLKELKEMTKHRGIIFNAALGWLMREDKIEVKASEHNVTVKLKG